MEPASEPPGELAQTADLEQAKTCLANMCPGDAFVDLMREPQEDTNVYFRPFGSQVGRLLSCL